MSNREIDIETFARENKEVPSEGVIYLFKVGRKICRWHESTITGRQILLEAELTPVDQYQLNQKFKHGLVQPVGYDEVVDLTAKGLERFTYMKLDQTEG